VQPELLFNFARKVERGVSGLDGRDGSVLFVCLGNICRSPLAELAMRLAAADAGLDLTIDSAGTGDWHVGRPPDPRARAEAARHGHDIGSYRARQIDRTDFLRFDHIIALDASNRSDLMRMRPADAGARLSLLLDHVPGREGEDVFDPYYGDAAGFTETWADVSEGAAALALRWRMLQNSG
jgi:protein-tyrosine phosphatase